MDDKIGPCEVLMTIGEGGMVQVYKCRRKVRPVIAYLLDDDPRATEVLDTAKRSLGIALAL
jgi:hypothetical protein